MYCLMFRMICFVYVICLVFVSFWIGYVGLSVFICVGVFSFNRFCSRVVILYVACSLWAHVFRNCVFSLVFCIVSALQCFLRLSMCYVCVFVLYVLFWLCVLHHIVSLRFGIFCVLGMRVCE